MNLKEKKRKNGWSEEDRAYIVKNYATEDFEVMEKHLKKSIVSIKRFARKIGVSKYNKNTPFGDFLNENGIDYDKGWQKLYSSKRTYYRRVNKPELLFLTEAVKLSKTINISLEELLNEFKKRNIKI